VNPSLVYSLAERIGVRNAIGLAMRRLRGKSPDGLYPVSAPGFQHPVYLRPYTTDPAVFKQVVRDAQYDILPPDADVGLVIDCGANIGLSSLFFLNRFNSCRVIAVEPDPSNFAVLQRNLRPYGARARTVNSGVWSHPARLRMSDDLFGDGREWARTVRECLPGEESQFVATDIGTMLRESGEQRISVLKIDVEGSEREIFARNYESWLPMVDALAVELHDDECRAIFERAVGDSPTPFEFREVHELTVGVRAARRP
jgi:FkbM family methyltransferase